MRSVPAFAALALLVLPIAARGESATYKFGQREIERMSSALQQTFAGLQYLLNPYQTKQFLSMKSDAERIEWLGRFWKQRDPTPTTPENEMEIEHNIRVKLAREYYGSKKWPGWDKRGEVFVRYGPPSYRGKIWADVNVRRMDPPGELWYYTRHNMLVSFQNFGLKGEYIYSIDPLGAAANLSPEMIEFLLYDTNESLSQKIPLQYLAYYSAPAYAPVPASPVAGREEGVMLSRERVLDPDIDALMDPDRVNMVPKNVADVFQKDQMREVANNFEIVLEETPSSYPFNFEQKPIPFYFAIDQFKGGTASNRVDISIELPVTIDARDPAASHSGNETYHAEVVFWDADYSEVARRERDIVVRADTDVKKWASLVPTQLTVPLGRGYYRIGISMKGEKTGRSSSYRTTLECQPYGARLALSDILFARRIGPAEAPSVFSRGALEVVPHPVRAYSRSFPMPIYFEIYNLMLDDRGVSSYTIEYKIIPHTQQKAAFIERFEKTAPVVASKFHASGLGPDDIQHLVIHTENLAKGAFDLLITLTDDRTQQVVYQKGTFTLVD
jgi:GWxTD domain-containing protein